MREPSCGPSWSELERGLRPEPQPQHPDLACERQDCDRERHAGEQHESEAEAEPLVRGELLLGKKRKGRERQGQTEVAHDGDPAHGGARSEARAGSPGATAHQRSGHRRREQRAERRGAEHRRLGSAEDTCGQNQLGGDQADPDDPLRAAVIDAERRQRGTARSRTRELRETGPRQHPPKDESPGYFEHVANLPSVLRGYAADPALRGYERMSEERLPGVTDPAAWRLKGAPGPPLRRAAVVALAPAIVLAVGLEKDPEVVATLTLAALLSGFIAFDAPARTRAIWITAMAPVAGLAVAIGALTSEPAALAAVAMGAGGAVVGYSWAISPRAYVAALSCLLGLLVVQGLFPGAAEAPELAALGLAGVLLQAAVAVAASVSWDRRREAIDMLAGMRTARASLISEFNLSTTTARHAIRFGLALAVGVAAYNVIDLREHGYWIPLTVLFVLRPDSAETIVRLGMRAAGSIVGVSGDGPGRARRHRADRGRDRRLGGSRRVLRAAGARVRGVHRRDHGRGDRNRPRVRRARLRGGRRAGDRDRRRDRDRRPRRSQPMATIRSIGSFARSASSGGTLTSNFISRSESRSFGRVIIFMYLQKAIRLASISRACGAACWSG